MKHAQSIYRLLLSCYPAAFRDEYGQQMRLTFATQLAEARRTRRRQREAAIWAQAVRDLLTVAPAEHVSVLRQDLRLAWRLLLARPAFAIAAMLSLALGIGANTALFSVWHGVLRAPLPGIADPDRLVLLTDPNDSGLLRGGWESRTDGPRAWLTVEEFETLRDRVDGVSLMASQSSLGTWEVRVGGDGPEEARGRLVSGGYFDVLGARAAIGRLFTPDADAGDSSMVVISHAYWQRRFGGRPDVLGHTLTIHDTPLTIIGVTAAAFIGETTGQRPDLWLPLRLQPRLLPGNDWRRDRQPDKVMWLHVFGRLQPGVTPAQIDARANTVFRSALQAFYGDDASRQRPELLDQRLRVQPAARGASAARSELGASLTVLLAAVGTLLLMMCANLANLLLARGAARRLEVAVRVSLGASRARLVRQFVTESVALGAAGGLAAIAVAWVLHGALVRLLQESDARLHLGFAFDAPMIGFAAIATLIATALFGLAPAWQMTRRDDGGVLEMRGRGAGGSSRELRSGRWLAIAQLALALPLVVGAGLLARTVASLDRTDLGFRPEGLLTARVNLGELVLDVPRRDRVLRELRLRLERVPGVGAASFSQLGLFSGLISTAGIEVDGATAPGSGPVDAALDRVGPTYFSTLGAPIVLGRDIAESDRADGRHVCVVNEAFVRRFFGARPPLGRQVRLADDRGRIDYEVVGVVGNPRLRDLRTEVEPRFYVPAEQLASLGTSRTFLIRTTASSGAVVAAVREALAGVDRRVSVTAVSSLDTQMARLTADDRILARLATVFGAVALALAAAGLYGLLSHGVARRSSEIAIRMAVGARPQDVVRLVMRETTMLVAAGLGIGAVAAWAAARLLAHRLHGVSPQDPLTLAVSAIVLMAVALVAAWLPARRAASVDPIAALQQG